MPYLLVKWSWIILRQKVFFENCSVQTEKLRLVSYSRRKGRPFSLYALKRSKPLSVRQAFFFLVKPFSILFGDFLKAGHVAGFVVRPVGVFLALALITPSLGFGVLKGFGLFSCVKYTPLCVN